MRNVAEITDAQIEALESEAGRAGDALQVYICRVALGAEYTLADLNDESCLDHGERRQIERMSAGEARAECARVIAGARAYHDDDGHAWTREVTP